jgi:chemotaxis protein CheD
MYSIRNALRRREALRAGRVEPTVYIDRHFGMQTLKILAGEYVASGDDVMLATLLGSCVAVCLFDAERHVGGMNHFLLPDSRSGRRDSEPARYGAYAMEMLINELLKLGARREQLQAKVFGGGNVVPGLERSGIGDRNAAFALEYLERESVPVVAQDLLGDRPRRVNFFVRDGRALVRRLPPAQGVNVLAQERLYESRLRDSPTAGSVELFVDE